MQQTKVSSIHIMTNEELLEYYKEKLVSHDWYGHMSDNYTIWKNSTSEWNHIQQIQAELKKRGLEDEEQELYDKHRK